MFPDLFFSSLAERQTVACDDKFMNDINNYKEINRFGLAKFDGFQT
jgi:hypothetical protein